MFTQKPVHECYRGSIHNHQELERTQIFFIGFMNKLRYIHIVAHHSTVKRNKLLLYATTWLTLKGIMSSEISQY